LKERLARTTSAAATAAGACHLALVVDQLEEVFSDERVTADERTAFFATLEALARSGVVWILSSMRSDAYERIAESPTLVALKEGDGQFDLLPPSLREIGQIIRLPAAAAGLRFESRPNTAEKLDDVIRDAAAQNPGALPLLQFLLEELYQRRNDEDLLTFRAYEELGGVEGALAQHAEKVHARVSEGARQALAGVLRELVTFGADDESRALRRVAPRSAFTTPGSNELVDALLEARLLVSGSGTDGTAVVSLAHEALLAFWPRVKAWVEEDRQLLLVHARLEAATREWMRNGRRADLLLPRGKPLSEAREVAAAGIRLGDAERALLTASLRRARRFAVLRAAAISGLAVLTIVAGIAAWRAQTESKRAQVQATTAQRTTDFMVGLFADADPDQSRGDKVTVREVLDRGVTRIAGELGEEPRVRTNLLRAMGQAYTGLGLYPRARVVLEQASAEGSRFDLTEDQVKVELSLGDNHYLDGDLEAAERLFRDALKNANRMGAPAAKEIAQANLGLAETLFDAGKSADAEDYFGRALRDYSSLLGQDSLEVARVLDGQGRLYFAESRFDDAGKVMQRALDIRMSRLGPADGSVGLSLNNMGSLYFRTGKAGLAADTFSKALPIYQHVYGDAHPRVAGILNNLGYAELVENDLPSAKRHLVAALDIYRKAYGTAHPDQVVTLNSLGMIESAEGNLSAAHGYLDEALFIARPRKHWALNQVVGNEAAVALKEKRLDDANELITEARRLLVAQYGDRLSGAESWRTGVLDSIDAERLAALGDREAARERLSSAFTLLRTRYDEKSFYLVNLRRIEKKIDNN
jgi:tetratricopeptide (TPR) repeat protein